MPSTWEGGHSALEEGSSDEFQAALLQPERPGQPGFQEAAHKPSPLAPTQLSQKGRSPSSQNAGLVGCFTSFIDNQGMEAGL